MVKRLLMLLFASVLVFSLSTPLLAQEKPAKPEKEKAAKQDRWEGMVTMISKDKSTMTVRHVGSNNTRTIAFDSATKFTSQEHGSKKVNHIAAADIKEGDRVICVGTWGKDNVLKATLISKRLTDIGKIP